MRFKKFTFYDREMLQKFKEFTYQNKKPKALTSGLKTHLLPVHTTMAQYQIYTKYMLISSFLQYLADNLLPFVVNVIAKHDVMPENLVPYTG